MRIVIVPELMLSITPPATVTVVENTAEPTRTVIGEISVPDTVRTTRYPAYPVVILIAVIRGMLFDPNVPTAEQPEYVSDVNEVKHTCPTTV